MSLHLSIFCASSVHPVHVGRIGFDGHFVFRVCSTASSSSSSSWSDLTSSLHCYLVFLVLVLLTHSAIPWCRQSDVVLGLPLNLLSYTRRCKMYRPLACGQTLHSSIAICRTYFCGFVWLPSVSASAFSCSCSKIYAFVLCSIQLTLTSFYVQSFQMLLKCVNTTVFVIFAIVTSAKEVMFYLAFVHLSVC